MLAGRNKTIKPQDILLLMKLLSKEGEEWRIIDVAQELKISPSEISMGLERLRVCGLIDSQKRKLLKTSIYEFFVYGLKYVFPVQLGTIARGIPTAHSLNIFDQKIMSDTKYVWATEEGEEKGIAVSPIYETAPFAALHDKKLHRLLALVDSIRLGRVREQSFAKKILAQELAVNEF